MVLFELLSGIDVDTIISTSISVGMVDCFKHALSFTEDKLPSQEIIEKYLAMHIHVKIMGKIVKYLLVDDGVRLNICSL